MENTQPDYFNPKWDTIPEISVLSSNGAIEVLKPTVEKFTKSWRTTVYGQSSGGPETGSAMLKRYGLQATPVLEATWNQHARAEHLRQEAEAEEVRNLPSATSIVRNWVDSTLYHCIDTVHPNGTDLTDTGIFYIRKPLGPLDGWVQGAMIRQNELENALGIHAQDLALKYGYTNAEGKLMPLPGLTKDLLVGHLHNLVARMRVERQAECLDVLRFKGPPESEEGRLPPAVKEFLGRILIGRLKLVAPTADEQRWHGVMIWQWLWQVKRAMYGYLSPSEASDRIMMVLYSKAGLVGKDVLLNLLTHRFMASGSRADVRVNVLSDSWGIGSLSRAFIAYWPELNFGHNPEDHIDDLKAIVTSYQMQQRQMRSENTASPVLFPSHIASSNRPISEIFDSPDDPGLARRLWQLELAVTKADEPELRATYGEFESFDFDSLWQAIDEDNPVPPIKRRGPEFLNQIMGRQVSILCPAPMAQVLTDYGVSGIRGDGVLVLKVPALTRLIHANLISNHSISEKTPERVTKDLIMKAIGPLGIQKAYYFDGGGRIDCLLVDEKDLLKVGELRLPTYIHAGTYFVEGNPQPQNTTGLKPKD